MYTPILLIKSFFFWGGGRGGGGGLNYMQGVFAELLGMYKKVQSFHGE